ncbi:hypothetical protein HC928_03980 [bacterium]|nr:hypothetical protein [bacterium]
MLDLHPPAGLGQLFRQRLEQRVQHLPHLRPRQWHQPERTIRSSSRKRLDVRPRRASVADETGTKAATRDDAEDMAICLTASFKHRMGNKDELIRKFVLQL